MSAERAAPPPSAGASLPALTELLPAEYEALDLPGARPFQLRSLRRWILQKGARHVDELTDLGKPLRAAIAARYAVRSSRVALGSRSDDGTTKMLLRLADDRTVETVLIPEAGRTTVCVSTQVGCGIRCAFCASGTLGVTRNLTAGEIVEQFLEARRQSEEASRPLTNMVLMGGGEPLNNFDHVKRALDIINAEDGCGFGARRITLSTIGIPAKIDRLEELGKQIHLAISLHAPDEALRGQLIPGLDRVPLRDVLAAAERYFQRTGREITLEYVLLKDVNDAPQQARELARLIRGLRGKVNLIPYNPVAGKPFERPGDAAVERFRAVLEEAGIKATVRRSRGRDIDAACGQLRRRHPTGESIKRLDPGTEPEPSPGAGRG